MKTSILSEFNHSRNYPKGIFSSMLHVLLIFCVALMSYVLLSNLGMTLFAHPYRLTIADAKSQKNFDCILVLGCLVHPDGTPSLMLSDRVHCGVELYKSTKTKLLLSGDHGKKQYNEVKTMQSICSKMGVPAQDIFLDHAGFSTYESAVRAKDVFGCKKVLVVTQDFHLDRAIFTLRSLGISAYGVAADQSNYGTSLPIAQSREILARSKSFIVDGFLHPAPTFLGPKIDIHGDGRMTHDK